jgi:hypothetical protein
MRPHRLLVTLALSLPAIAGLTACSSDSTSPKSQAAPAVDTILADIDNLGVLDVDTIMTTDTSITYGLYTYGADQYVGWYYYNNGSQASLQNYRPVITFNLPALAGQKVVDSAKAYVFQCASYGTTGAASVDPFTLGHVLIDHVAIGRVIESNLSTYAGDTLQANIGTISSDSTAGVRSMTVTSNVQADYAAKRSASQYRLRWLFTSAPTVASNYAEYYAALGTDCGNSNGGPGPWLVIWSH